MNKRSFALPIVAAIVMLGASVPTVFAGTSTLVVDDDGAGTAANCNAAAAAFSTISAAVTAASAGDTIIVCPGTYAEQVVVNKNRLKIRGAHRGQSAFGCPARSAFSRVTGVDNSDTGAFWIQANRVLIDGFTIQNNDGPGVQLGSSWHGARVRNNRIAGNVMGISLQASGASRTYVDNNCILNNNDPGPSAGNGIYSDAGLHGASIDRNSFRGHTNSAILLLGTGTSAVDNVTITNNTSHNDITFANLSDVQNVLVHGNTVTQDKGGPGGAGSAIRVGDFSGGSTSTGVQIIENTITSPHFAGVAIRESADGVVVARNTIDGTENGVDNTSSSPGAAVIRNNTITGVSGVGIYQQAGTSQNLIHGNSISGSAVEDCQDDTTGPDDFGVANHWSANGCVPA